MALTTGLTEEQIKAERKIEYQRRDRERKRQKRVEDKNTLLMHKW